MESVPSLAGSYALHLLLEKSLHLSVGRLGTFDFPVGDYVYLGSAHGPGGLRARLQHHHRVTSHPHWHLDWLRPYAVLQHIWYSLDHRPLECAWAQSLLRLPEAWLPAFGFGSADCRSGCAAHLVAFSTFPEYPRMRSLLRLASLSTIEFRELGVGNGRPDVPQS